MFNDVQKRVDEAKKNRSADGATPARSAHEVTQWNGNMRAKTISQVANAFFDAYQDPEISKRLFFDVWADRTGCNPAVKQQVWEEVRRITYQLAARKRQAVRQPRTLPARTCRSRCNAEFEVAM